MWHILMTTYAMKSSAVNGFRRMEIMGIKHLVYHIHRTCLLHFRHFRKYYIFVPSRVLCSRVADIIVCLCLNNVNATKMDEPQSHQFDFICICVTGFSDFKTSWAIFILVINQLDAQNFCFTISLFPAATCFEHVLIIRRSKLHYMCSKHVEAWNKLIVKQKFCASSWLYTEMHGQQNIKKKILEQV